MTYLTRLGMGRVSRALVSAIAALAYVLVAHATIDASLQMQLGNPSNAATDATNHLNYLIPRDQYGLDYDDTTREPNWVSWDLTTSDIGSSGRSNFIQDTTLPVGFYQVLTTDYSGSGYDRGHMCPSADRTVTAADNQQLFYMSNMVPQAPDNNQGVWANFESYCRSLASAGNEILITCGPSGFSGSTIASGVAIPGYTWKIVVVVPLGSGSAVSRIDASTRVIAIKVPNIAGVRSTPWQDFVTSVAQIEADTGYTFFTNLPASTRNALRLVVDGQTTTGAPAIAVQPSAQTTVVGGSATFSVSATGDAPLAYQWYRDDDTAVAAGTDATLTLSNVQAADLGSYYVVVSNGVGTVTSNAAPLVVLGIPPSIAASPATATANAGSTVTLAVSATGSPTLTYQWRKDAAALAGATTSTLTLLDVQSGNAGGYDVVVTNGSGSATSALATLSVVDVGPTITKQPTSKSTTTGSNASFSVAASGTNPLTYVWRKDGTPLVDGGAYSGSASATLVITSASAANAGAYDVVVANGLGSVTSTAATLTVNPPAPSAVYWDFGPAIAPTAAPTSGLPSDITGGVVTQGNNNGTTDLLTTTSASSGYTGVSGAVNIGAAARIGGLNQGPSGSAYFEFTLTPADGKRLYASGISFGTRSTSTGPQAWAVYTSVDGFTAPVATGTTGNDSKWRLFTPAFSAATGATGTPVTFRIYGYNGAGSPSAGTANWRVDDLKLLVTTIFPPPVAPVVTTTTPANGATAVPFTSPITVSFNEAVGFTGSWFSINSALNGPVSAVVSGGPTTFTLTPPSFFSYNDTITVTIHGAQVVDQASGSMAGTSDTAVSFQIEQYVPPTPPAITTQPGARTVNVGDPATFAVAASGTPPLTYQWRKDSLPIAGNPSASTTTLTIATAALTDAGSYDCVVSNAAGSDVSHAATLTVLVVPPTIAVPPVAQAAPEGGAVAFTAVPAGTAPFTYQWRKNGTPLSDGPVVSGTATATLNLTGLTYADTGAYDVVVTNSAGSATSRLATLAVMSDTPSTIYWNFGTADPTSGVPAGVTGGTVTQGNNNGTTALLTTTSASGGYAGASGGNNAGAAARTGALNQNAGGSAYFEFTFTPPAGRQFAATAISFGARSTGTGPQAYAIFSSVDNFAAPLATGVLANDSKWALVTPALAGVTSAPAAPVTFRIYGYNGTGSPAAGTANWRIDDVKLTAGLLAVPIAPSIVGTPNPATATVGDTVTFSVAATGTGPLTYSWRKDGTALAGNTSATTTQLTLANITTADAGNYDCVVANIAGTATTVPVALTVNKAAATVTLGDLSFVYDGAAHPATATTAPADLNVTFTYNGDTTVPSDAGVYLIAATIDDPNYTGSASGTLVISKAPATVALGALQQTYDGSAKGVSATTAPAGLNVVVTYDGLSAAPVNAGSYAVLATVQDRNYAGSTTGTLVIAKASATIALGNLHQSYDGTPRPVTVTTAPNGLATVVTYNASLNAPTNPGVYAVVATISDSNYAGSTSDTLVIAAAALVRHAPTLNGGVDGSIQVLLPESATLNGSAWVSGDMLVPGTPAVVLNGHPTYAGTQDGSGALPPSNYAITLNGGAVLRHVVRRTDPIALPVVVPPPVPAGTRSVSLNRAGQSIGDFATVRDLTLNGNVGAVAVSPGTYGRFTANGHSAFVLGLAGSTAPVAYNLQSLTLNGGSELTIVSPVVLTLASGVTINASPVGSAEHPEWLVLQVASGGVTLNGGADCNGTVIAPVGTVTIDGSLRGTVVSDRLVINGSGSLEQP